MTTIAQEQGCKEEVYEDILEEAKQVVDKLQSNAAKAFVPRLCNALRSRYPDKKDFPTLQKKVVKDCMAVCGWSERYVGGCWPDWIKNPDRVKGGVAAQKILAEQREQQKLIQKVTEKLPAINFVEPKEHERSDATAYVRNQEEVRQEEEIRQIDQHSPFHIVGEINRYLAKLWTALTGLKNMPHMADDVKISYIKPTRDFRKNIANGIPKADRIQVNNWILWVEMALEDMRDTLEKADATAFDR